MEIDDISKILNFRFPPMERYLGWEYIQSRQLLMRYLGTPPPIYKHFKFSIYNKININENANNNDVFCNTEHIGKLDGLIKQYDIEFDDLTLMGTDKKLSKNIKHIEKIKHRFDKIYFEAKDIECDWVLTLPMGMNVAYMLRNGGNDILHHINKPKNKTKLIASAFGSIYLWLNNQIKDRSSLHRFTLNTSFMDDMFCDPLEYYEKLCEYKFFACPLGNGIQTPKICESIMCETIPVVTNHIAHQELRDIHGLPLLIVNKWTDLTKEFLDNQYESEYSNIDWNKQKSKFLVRNLEDEI